MMKKDLLNKQVVRAISLGLSAVMLTTPMTALAAEGTDIDATGADGDNEIALPAETTLEVAEDAATEAVLATGDADKAVDTVVDTTDKVLTGNSKDWSSDDQAILEAEQALVDTNDDDVLDQPTQEMISGDGYEAPGQIDGVQEELRVAADADDKADTAIESADSAVDTMNATAASTAGTMSDAQTDVDNKIAEIEGATSSAAAEKGYVELQDIVDKAEADYAAAETEYNNAKDAYDKAVAEVDAAKAAYDQAIANATGDVEAALAQLEAAEDKAAALEEAAKDAADNVEKTSASAFRIMELQKDAADDSSAQWNNTLDPLFAEIMSAYYLPNFGGDLFESDVEGCTYELGKWKKYSPDSRNYITVYLKDANGKVIEEVYVNYKLEEKTQGLIIFEKTFEDLYTYKDANGKKVEMSADAYADAVIEGEVENTVSSGIVEDVESVDGDTVDVAILGEGNTVTEDINGEISDENTSYQYDADGNLVKTVTGTVTTITKTEGVTLEGETFDSEEARDEAMAAESLVEGRENVDLEVTSNTVTTGYTIEGGYYIPTFTKDIEISVTIDNRESEISDAEIQQKLAEEVQAALERYINSNKNDKYFFNEEECWETSEAKITSDTEFHDYMFTKWDWTEYKKTATTTLSITYAKIETDKVDYSNWDDFWDWDTDQKAEVIAETKADVESEGGIYLGFEGWDGSFRKGTYAYVAGVAIEDDTVYATEAEAKAAQEAAANGIITKDGVTGQTKKVYSYKGTYTQVDTDTKQGQTISTTTWDAAEVSCVEDGWGTNDKYLAGEYKFEEWDEDGSLDDGLEAFLNAAAKKLADYRQIQAEADAAEKAANDALDELNALKEALKAAAESGYVAEIAELAGQLAQAEANWKLAKDAYDDIQEKASEMEEDIESIIDDLKAAEEAANAGGEGAGDADDDGTTGGTTPTTPVVVPVATPEEIPTAVVTPIGGAGVGAGAAVVDIEDEATPLAAGIDNGNGDGDANGGDGDEVLVAGAEDDETAIVAIEDEETPLAAGSGADGKMSWWWLLIVALLGATGYKMYKDHQKKKEEAAQEA